MSYIIPYTNNLKSMLTQKTMPKQDTFSFESQQQSKNEYEQSLVMQLDSQILDVTSLSESLTDTSKQWIDNVIQPYVSYIKTSKFLDYFMTNSKLNEGIKNYIKSKF